MRFSIRKKLLFLIAVLSLALIIASVLISSRLYSDSLEQNMKGLCTETADSLRESLESDHIDFRQSMIRTGNCLRKRRCANLRVWIKRKSSIRG